jgi:hypothetical protein
MKMFVLKICVLVGYITDYVKIFFIVFFLKLVNIILDVLKQKDH